jgi:hypothetical protein
MNEIAIVPENNSLQALQKFEKSLNIKPPIKAIRTQTIDGKIVPYLPISYIEQNLKKLYFGLYQMEIISYQMIVNEICVHARIRVFHPLIREWMIYDGIGAVPVQQNSGSPVSDFVNTKKVKALQKNLPAAYALAIKNAAKKIGKLFGGDLGREYEEEFTQYDFDKPLNASL